MTVEQNIKSRQVYLRPSGYFLLLAVYDLLIQSASMLRLGSVASQIALAGLGLG